MCQSAGRTAAVRQADLGKARPIRHADLGAFGRESATRTTAIRHAEQAEWMRHTIQELQGALDQKVSRAA